jgi:hypothetical protein
VSTGLQHKPLSDFVVLTLGLVTLFKKSSRQMREAGIDDASRLSGGMHVNALDRAILFELLNDIHGGGGKQ